MSFIAEMEKESETTFEDAQVALARQWLGPDEDTLERTVKIKSVQPTQGDPQSLGMTVAENPNDKVKDVKVPGTYQQAVDIIKKFESGAKRSDEEVSDTISQHVQQDKTGIKNERWLGEHFHGATWGLRTQHIWYFRFP